MMERVNDVLSFRETQELLKIGKNTLLGLIRDKSIEAFKIGARWKILKVSVIEYITNKL